MSLSSKDEVKAFATSKVWRDFKNEMEKYVEAGRNELESCSDLREVSFVQGRINAFRFVIALPELIIEDLEQEEKEKEDASG